VGQFSTGSPLPMIGAMFACAAIAFVLGRIVLVHPHPQAEPQAQPAE
jgi:hypothetical protein